MTPSRRQAIQLLAGAGSALASRRAFGQRLALPEPIQPGPFQGTRDSLATYEIPDWFRDAKFGIWAHWGPQSAPENGDWYARKMYIQGDPTYKFHVDRYGHPSKFGFKDVVPTWKGDLFDPEHLIGLYKKAGARYFVSMGVHHDNFDLWNSKHQRWNAANMGPKKDIVGLWRDAARKAGLRFGVSEHLWISYKWFAVSHWSDQTGPLAGVPYDGLDPQFQDLYHNVDLRSLPELPKMEWSDADIPESYKRHWYSRIKDLVDNYEPDLLYTDGAMPFEDYGLNLVAHHYNLSAGKHGGKTQAIYNSKRREDCEAGTCVLDVERGVVDRIWPTAWQTDTCVGDWHYRKGIQYKSPKTVIDLLCDIVSRNGNLLLNFPLPNSGMPDAEELRIVDDITKWMSVNSEGIYDTRPWKIYGEGPSTAETKQQASFNEKNKKTLGAADVRFTTKGRNLYAFVMGWPEKQAIVTGLGRGKADKIGNVELLGYGGKLDWTQGADGLTVALPADKPSDHAVTLKVTWA